MTVWLTIIGVGADGLEGLPPAARGLVQGADIIVGSARLLTGCDLGGKEVHDWTSPLSEMIARIGGWRGRQVAVLTTGDPMHFGAGVTLARTIAAEEMRVVPAPSAFSLAAARLGWPLNEVECLSLHGRPAALLVPAIQPGNRVLALTSGAETVADAAKLLAERGFGGSRLTVLEHMGGADERRLDFPAGDGAPAGIADFNLLAIECIAAPDAALHPRVPGLPDEAFRHDGQLTKREVRAVTLAALAPAPRALLWDVGAGCGSIAIEWLRAERMARAVAFEKDEARQGLVADNAVALGVPHLETVAGSAPESLAGQPAPDAVFLGGAVADDAVFEACWQALKPGGRFAANAVTLAGEAALIARQARFGGDLVRLDVAHLDTIGGRQVMRPRMSVLQWRAAKVTTP